MAPRPRSFSFLSSRALLSAALFTGLASGLVASCSSVDPLPTSSATGAGGESSSSAGGAGGDGGAAASGTGGSGGATTSSGTGGGDPGCMTDADCAGDPKGELCNVDTGDCVSCLPTNDMCLQGQFCDPKTNECAVGCTDNTDCDPANNVFCDLPTNTCVGCLMDANCPLGSICISKTCIPGCNGNQPCQMGFSCCGSNCYDLANDPEHCGGCTTPCEGPANAESICNMGVCGMGACNPTWSDCDGDPSNGCEQNELQDGACVCSPGSTQSCYFGAPGTAGVGPCKAGTQTCAMDGISWGPCVGQVMPASEICANGQDEDCDGTADNSSDDDFDGWQRCQNDCCDSLLDGCSDPVLVNPGAFDFPGNGVDDDCDSGVDNAVLTCDNGLASNSGTATDYAKAIDLCATTTENPATIENKKWGVISATLSRANGAGAPATNSRAIRPGFGTNITPLKGTRVAVISTGHASDTNDVNPGYSAFQGGTSMATTSPVPADWLQANNNNFPNAPGCPDPQGGTTANDPVMLKVRVRVPTNAKSFDVSTFFLTTEYSEWVCSAFNDFFLTLLDSTFVPAPGESANPTDKNLAFYDPPPAGAPFYPVGVNLAFGNTGLFSQCKNGPTGCGGGAVPGNTNTCTGTTLLTGTGFDIANPPSQFANDPGWCGASNLSGGGTGWLTTSGNVKPGETIEVRFVIWDTGDGWYDSVSLLDNFSWSAATGQPGTHN